MPAESDQSHAAIEQPADLAEAITDTGLLVEIGPGTAALMPAELVGRDFRVAQREAILVGATEPGGELWRALKANGWKWTQDGAFSQKYWRRDLDGTRARRKPRRE